MKAGRLTIDRTTLAREACRALRTAILDRRLRANQKLVVRALAEDLGLSPTPIKEALAALEREGLVIGVPHRGYFVPSISPHDAEELYALREVVEGLAARLAAERCNERLIVQIRRILTRQRACVESADVERYGDLDLAFHSALREASGNARISRLAESFDGQIRLLISTSAKLPGRLQASLKEHFAIAQAIEAKDSEAAETAMRQHVRLAGLALKAHLNAPTDAEATPPSI